MSPRLPGFVLVFAIAVGCGGAPAIADEPTTAKQKQLRDAKAAGTADAANKGWGKWRYSGARDNCFFVVGGKCFKTETAACEAARCAAPKRCQSVGGGPATVGCK